MKFAVIGAGSWGTALANLLGENNHSVILWAREPEVVEGINRNRHNPFFTSELELNKNITATNNLKDAVENSELALLSIPSSFIGSVILPVKNELKKLKGIINVAKGFEQGTGKRISELICNVLEIVPFSSEDKIACLSGPNIASEVALKKVGASVIAAPNEEVSRIFQECLSTEYFRLYSQTDRTGVELGGTLKNIYAIGAGIVDGLNLGDNAKAAYLTRSLHEMMKLGVALGGKATTFSGLAGLGDLITTSNSPMSRNHRLGEAIARGISPKAFQSSTKMVIEGVEAARIARDWGRKLNIQLPITEEICNILFESSSAHDAAANLMKRSLKSELD